MELTSRERFNRMFEHKDADRIPVTDVPWQGSLARWKREGMPEGVSFEDFFGMDKLVLLWVDNSPRFEAKTIEETDRYKIYTTPWGVTQKSFKALDSTPEFLAHTICDPDTWRKYKHRVTPDPDRIDWSWYETEYRRLREEGAFMAADLLFGFDWTHSWVVGTETVLMALIEEPEWCIDMFSTFLNNNLALFQMLWDRGYRFDAIRWPEDMGYKGNTFFSLNTYREILKPIHKKAIDWAHEKGIKACMHSCGNITTLIPDLLEIGLDCLNPLEVKAGVDALKIKKDYGDRLVLHGGINAALFSDAEAFEAEMTQKIPILKENGGYIFSSDHSVPPEVSLKDFKHIVGLAKKLGSY